MTFFVFPDKSSSFAIAELYIAPNLSASLHYTMLTVRRCGILTVVILAITYCVLNLLNMTENKNTKEKNKRN